MKSAFFAQLTVAAAVALAAPAFADQALATAKNCMTCHAVDKKLVGPAYKEVATKYGGQKDAVDKLAAKIMKGEEELTSATTPRPRVFLPQHR